jgi:hypothetical protein
VSSAHATILLADWLATRTPQPPAALVDRMKKIVGVQSCAESELSNALVDAAVTVFDDLTDDRASAIDLLAADALITYAMQASADSDVERAASSAMMRIANAMRAQ